MDRESREKDQTDPKVGKKIQRDPISLHPLKPEDAIRAAMQTGRFPKREKKKAEKPIK